MNYFENQKEFHYEIHHTLHQETNINKFKSFCTKNNIKPIIIDLPNNQQHITTSIKYKTLNQFILHLNNITETIINKNFKIIRTKIETIPNNPIKPLYYEKHYKLIINDNINLNNIINKYNLHKSINPFKKVNDKQYIQMVTLRKYNIELDEFIVLDNRIKKDLYNENISYLKSNIEKCIYDTNINLDNNWLQI